MVVLPARGSDNQAALALANGAEKIEHLVVILPSLHSNLVFLGLNRG